MGSISNSTKFGILCPRTSSWAVKEFISQIAELNKNTVSVFLENGIEAIPELENISNLEFYKNTFSLNECNYEVLKNICTENSVDHLIIPAAYPYNSEIIAESIVKEGLNLKIHSVVLEDLAIYEMHKLFKISNSVFTYSTNDKYNLILQGISSGKIKNMPVFLNNKDYIKEGLQKIIIPDTGFTNKDYDQIISACYDIAKSGLKTRFLLVKAPHDYNNSNEDNFSKQFIESIDLRGLSGIISVQSKKVNLIEYKALIEESDAVLMIGSSRGTQLARRALSEITLNHNSLLIRESTTGSDIIDQSSLKLKPFNEKSLGKSLQEIANNYEEIYQSIYDVSKDVFNNEKSYDQWINLVNIPESSKIEEVNKDTYNNISDNQVITLNEVLPRVVLKNRSNALTHPGGDTVVMERILEGLKNEGFDVVLDLEDKEDLSKFDLAHLFNFAIREVTESHARACVNANTPYVVTTLYEDWPVFYNQMAQMYVALDAYVKHGQPKARWNELESAAKEVQPSQAWDNSYSANNAHAMIATGESEAESLLRDYPSARKVVSIPLGCEISDLKDGGELFRQKYGIQDFVFCVGRLEWRKNQLMLLKALEDKEYPVVFAASSFTYQPPYAELCKKFKRKGETIFLDRLTPDELASAYQAARVHALPSWFELPGLVNLEAGRYGTAVVVSNTGSTKNYVKDYGFYCSPDSADSIRSAVEEAYNTGPSEALETHFSTFTWERTVKEHAKLYREILGIDNSLTKPVEQKSKNEEIVILSDTSEVKEPEVVLEGGSEIDIKDDLSREDLSYEELCEKGDKALVSGKTKESFSFYEKAHDRDKSQARPVRSMGAVLFYQGNFDEASTYFSRSLEMNPQDVKSILGKGAILWEKGDKEKAYQLYKQASDLSPGDESVVLYLVNASYELSRLQELQEALRKYLRLSPDNISIQYCLAGCYYKLEKYSAAKGVIERMLTLEPANEQALELKSEIENKLNERETSTVQDVKSDLASSIEIETAEASKVKALKSDVAEISEIYNKLDNLKNEKKYSEIVSICNRKLLDDNIDSSKLSLYKAEALTYLGSHEEAKVIFYELVKDEKLSPNAHSGLGVVAALNENWNEASRFFEKALYGHPNMDIPLAGLGIAAKSLGEDEDAWNYFVEALKRNPENMQSLYGLMDLGYKLNRISEVEEYIEKYLELKPVDFSMLYSLAGCLYSQGKASEALLKLNDILLLNPEHQHAKELAEKISIENGQSENSMH